jgi:hypothetical protein
MPTQRDQVLGRLAVDLGYLTHEQIGKAFIDHQMQVQNQGVKVSFAEMLVIKGLLTGDRARELEEAAAVECGAAPPETAPSSASDRSPGPTKRRRRRPTTRSASPIRGRGPGNQMWIAAGGGAGILLLAVVSYLMLAGGSPEDARPSEPGADTEKAEAGKPRRSTRVTLTPVTETIPAGGGIAVEPGREPEGRSAALVVKDAAPAGAMEMDPEIAELLAAAEAAAERAGAAPPVAPPAPPAAGIRQGLVGHWTFDEGRGTVAMDMSGHGANGTVKGARWVRGRIRGALEFDGADDSVAIARPVQDDFTMAMWVKTSQAVKMSPRQRIRASRGQWYYGKGIVDGEVRGFADDFGMSMLEGSLRFGTGDTDVTVASTSRINDGTWRHVAATRRKSTGEIKVYVDGREEATKFGSTNSLTAPSRLTIGSLQNDTGHFKGAIDDVRFYDRVLVPAEIGALAGRARLAATERGTPADAGGFEPKPPPTPRAPAASAASATAINRGLVGHWTFDEGRGTVAMDMSGKGANGTVKGGTWTRGRIGGALEFDGTSDHVTVANESNFDITSTITVAAWIRADSFTRFFQAIVCKGDSSWRLHRYNVKNFLQFVCDGPGGRRRVLGRTRVNDGAWHHVAGVYDGRTVYLYVDGEVDASTPATGSMVTSDAPVHIGDNSDKPERRWHGAIDDVRVYDRALPADEIRTLADPARLAAAERGATGGAEAPVARPAAPPAPPVARVSNRGLVGHWTFDEGHGTVAGDSSGKGGSATVHGARWTAGRVGGALVFDGVDDYVDLPDGFVDFTGGLTFALWARPTSVRKWGRFIDLADHPEGERIHFTRRGRSDGAALAVHGRRGLKGIVTADGAIRLNQWQHLAATIDARGNAVIHRNGVPVKTGTVRMPARVRWVRNYIAKSNAEGDAYYKGAIDDVRVYCRALSTDEIRTLADPARLTAAERETPAEAEAPRAAPPQGPFDRLLVRFDAHVGKGDYAAACKFMADAARNADLADRSDALGAAVRVCESLVTRELAMVKAAVGLAGQEVTLGTRAGPVKGEASEVNAGGFVVLQPIVVNRIAMGSSRNVVRWADIAPEQGTELAAAGGGRLAAGEPGRPHGARGARDPLAEVRGGRRASRLRGRPPPRRTVPQEAQARVAGPRPLFPKRPAARAPHAEAILAHHTAESRRAIDKQQMTA